MSECCKTRHVKKVLFQSVPLDCRLFSVCLSISVFNINRPEGNKKKSIDLNFEEDGRCDYKIHFEKCGWYFRRIFKLKMSQILGVKFGARVSGDQFHK